MKKDFDQWNDLKKSLQTITEKPRSFHDREIWWCSLGINLGVETDGKNDHFLRPVLILRRFNEDMALIAPLTRASKDSRFHHTLAVQALRDSRVVLSQLRTISSKRLRARMARVPEKEFRDIQNKIIALNFPGAECKNPSGEGF